MPERVFGFRVLVGVPAFVACAGIRPGRVVCVVVLDSSSVERRFVLYRTLPASPAPHQLRLSYRNTRVVSSARGEVSLCAACRCVLSWHLGSVLPCELRFACTRGVEETCSLCSLYSYREYTLHRPSSTGRGGLVRAQAERRCTPAPAGGGRAVVGRKPSIASPG